MGICLDCLGTGRRAGNPCETCKGTGEVEKTRTEIVQEEEAKKTTDEDTYWSEEAIQAREDEEQVEALKEYVDKGGGRCGLIAVALLLAGCVGLWGTVGRY